LGEHELGYLLHSTSTEETGSGSQYIQTVGYLQKTAYQSTSGPV